MNKKWLVPSLIVLLAAAAYHNCLHNEMFWDDDDFILKNRYIRDWRHFPQFFTENLVAGSYLLSNYWRPLLLTIFASAWHLWERWLPGWHSLNIMFHALNGVLVYFLFARLFARRALAAGAAFLFVAHPVHNEAVVYVNSLGDPLASFFVLCSLLLYLRYRQGAAKPSWASRNYWFSLACYAMALLSKETGFVLCGLLPLMDVWLIQKHPQWLGRVRRSLVDVWPFLVLAAVYVALRATALNFNNSFNFYESGSEFGSRLDLRMWTFFKACTQYAGFLFFPYQLRVERQMPYARSLLEWDALAGAVLVGLMVFGIFKYWRIKPLLSFGMAWFFISIVPASNILVPINAVIYEHFLYLPMVGIMLVVVDAALRAFSAPRQPRAQVVLMIVLAIFCAINIRRNQDWRTAIGFYEQLVQYAPSYRVINNLGMEYANRGLQEKAFYWYQRAIALDPNNPVAYHNLAGTYRDTGKEAMAEAMFKKAISLDPNFIFSYRALADFHYQRKNWTEALNYLSVLVRYDPADEAARHFHEQARAQLQSRGLRPSP